MTPDEMALSSTVPQSITTRDFAASQSSFLRHDFTQSHEIVISRSYLLIQESQDRLILALSSEDSGPSYHVRLHYQNGSIFRKSHMTITKEQERRSKSVISIKSRYNRPRSSIFGAEREHGKTELAVAEIGIHETDIKIVYKGKSYAQSLRLSDPSTQSYTCSIDGREHQWRPLGPSRTVLELVRGEKEQRVALFLYGGDISPGSDACGQRRVSLGVRHNVGELHTLVDVDEETRVHEEVLCSALAVVESRRIT